MSASTAIELSASDLTKALSRVIEAKRVPFVKGSPGIGKSAVIWQLCQKYNLEPIDFRLAQADPTELQGFAVPIPEESVMRYLPLELIPLEHTPLPKGKDGWLLFLDEYPNAPLSVQHASYKVVLDRKIGQFNMHNRCVIVAAGNKDTDKAGVMRLSTAAQSRFVHFHMKVSSKDFLAHAAGENFDHRLTAYIKWKPDNLFNFRPDHSNDTFACPRTWEIVHDMIHTRTGELDSIDLANIAGAVGPGVGREFFSFTKIYKELPTFEAICMNPDGIAIPEKPDVIHAMTSLISHPDNLDKLEKALPFVERLPIEYQVWCLRDIIRKKPDLLNTPALNEWKRRNAKRIT